MTDQLRSWFLRDVIETVERERGSGALERLWARLPDRIREQISPDSLRRADLTATVALDDAEEILLALESISADGSARVLEAVAQDVAVRLLCQQPALVQPRDLMRTVARMRMALERLFAGAELSWELGPSHLGFTLTVAVRGRPRTARLLRHIMMGLIRGSERYAMEARVRPLRLFGDVFGERATVTADYRTASLPPPPPEDAAITTHTSRPRMRAVPTTNVADEVSKILGAVRAPLDDDPARRTSQPRMPRVTPPAPRRASGELAAVKPPEPKKE